MTSEQYLKAKNMRKQATSEIIVDIDDRTMHGLRCFMQSGINLVEAGYHIELWYADGMKSPHIHIKNIINLDALSKEEGIRYRKLFYTKYIPKEFWRDKKIDDDQGEIPDWSLCNPYEEAYHLIAEENKSHHKYKTLKTLRSEFNKSAVNQIELELWDKAKEPETTQTTNSGYIPHIKLSTENPQYLFQKIAQRISILYIADLFGLKPMGRKLRVCPFHADTNPSLSLDEQGLFHCFGCHVKGNIILFYAMLKELNPLFKIEVVKQ